MTEKPKILVVDDDEGIRTQMKWALIQDYDVYLAKDGKKALHLMEREHPSLVTLDLGLPPNPEDTSEGFRLLSQIMLDYPSVKVIVVSGHHEREAALKAISNGAYDFFTKPINIEELKAMLKRGHYVHTLETEYSALQSHIQRQPIGGEIIGSSEKMQGIFTTVRRVATTDVSVLIAGESGTGKELIARAIHFHSIRKNNPFIPINCGAIPENLMESELFGHEKGAFTGAHIQRKGRIELANCGTLFLDEIAELPLSLQVKILRFLQDHKIERVGGRETIEVDLRVVAATNKDIKRLISEGLFREDLYYRLAVVTIDLPPLRERGEDIFILAKTFLKKFAVDGREPKKLSSEAIDAIMLYEWPGNVRELENKMRRAITLAEGPTITPGDIGLAAGGANAKHLDLKIAREMLDRQYICLAISKNNGNISKAAEELGLTRSTIHYLINKYNIKYREGV